MLTAQVLRSEGVVPGRAALPARSIFENRGFYQFEQFRVDLGRRRCAVRTHCWKEGGAPESDFCILTYGLSGLALGGLPPMSERPRDRSSAAKLSGVTLCVDPASDGDSAIWLGIVELRCIALQLTDDDLLVQGVSDQVSHPSFRIRQASGNKDDEALPGLCGRLLPRLWSFVPCRSRAPQGSGLTLHRDGCRSTLRT